MLVLHVSKKIVFFQIGENASLDQDLMVFEDNVAPTGSVLLGGSIDRCVLDGYPEVDSGRVFDKIANYSMQPHTVSVITSIPYYVWCMQQLSALQCK